MLSHVDEEDRHPTGVGRQKQLFAVLARITQSVDPPSTVRLHHDHRPDLARRDERVGGSLASGSNFPRRRGRHGVTATEAVDGHGDALARTGPEHGRARRAELAPTGSRIRARLHRQTGSGNQLVGDGTMFTGTARYPDVDDGSRVIQHHGRVAATSVENCK